MMKKRFLTLLTVFCLIAAMLPAPARADGNDAEDGVEMTGETLQALIDGADGGDTVTLSGNCTATIPYILVSKALTIDLGGHTLTFHTPSEGMSQGVYASGAEVVLRNGSIKSDSTGTSTALFISNSGRIVLDGVEVAASGEGSGYAATLRGGSLAVDSQSSLTSSTNAAIYGYGADANAVDISGKVTHTGTFSAVQSSYVSDTGPMAIDVHDGAVIDGGEGAGILQMAPGRITVDGGSITGTTSGVAMTKGELSISGGKIKGTGSYGPYQPSASYKVYDNGAAVYVEPFASDMKVSVSGGGLTSESSYALSVPKEGNTRGYLTLAITGGSFAGGGKKDAIDAGGETGFLSGGTFPRPVDSAYLAGADIHVKKSAGGSAFTYGTPEELLKSADDVAYRPDSLDKDGNVKKPVSIRFAFNGGTTAEVKEQSDYSAAADAVIKLPGITRSGYTFDGWQSSDESDTKLYKDTYTVPESDGKTITLTAQWRQAEIPPSGDGPDNPGGDDPDNPDNPGGDKPTTPAAALTGTVSIVGEPWVGETLTALVRGTNNTGTLHYQWTANNYYIYGETSSRLRLTGYEVGKTIRCEVTSSVQTGTIVGRYWDIVDYYDSRYYPTTSPTNSSNNNTGANQGGNAQTDNDPAIESPLFTTTTNTDGTKTTTIVEPDGSSGVIALTSYGLVSSVSMTFSSSAYTNAMRAGSILTVPAAVQASRSADSAVPVRIVLPLSNGSVKVKIPVSHMTAGTVAVMENYFGPNRVVRSSVSQSDGVLFNLTGSAVIRIVDNSRSFWDVPGGVWYENAVNWASSREVLNGVSTQSFDPQGTVSRAMMTQMLYNFDGAQSTDTTPQFSDVSSGAWYAASVAWATKNGIARADGERFGAEDALTREDMAAMLYSYARLKGYNPYASGSIAAFSDGGEVSDWAQVAMQWAVGVGLITGTQNGTRTVVLDPQGSVTRAQLATIMQRFNNLY